MLTTIHVPRRLASKFRYRPIGQYPNSARAPGLGGVGGGGCLVFLVGLLAISRLLDHIHQTAFD
jgi:hypothetical protein